MTLANGRILLTSAALVVAFVAGFLLRPAIGSMIITTDGVWWDTLSTDNRPDVVAGMLDAYVIGFSSGQASGWENGIIGATTQLDKKTGSKLIAWSAKAQESKVVLVITPSYPKAFGDYVDEISAFYRKYPALNDKVTVGQVVGCVSSSPIPSCDELAQNSQ